MTIAKCRLVRRDAMSMLNAMSDCGCGPTETETRAQRQVLWIALLLNSVMFVVEMIAGLHAHSTGLIADGLDMLADAAAYAIALSAVNRGSRFKSHAALLSGIMLLLLGIGVVIDVMRRLFTGEPPEGSWMIGVSAVALAVNATVLWLLSRQRRDEAHIQATWIFTRADVIANLAVIFSGIGVWLTGNRYFDLAVGGVISLYVSKEALEIFRKARETKTTS